MAVDIQNGEILLGQWAYSLDVTIANVGNLAKAYVEIQTTAPTGTTNHTVNSVTASITSLTNLRLERGNYGAALTVKYSIVVDDDSIVQSGELVLSGSADRNVTISNSNTLNSFSITTIRANSQISLERIMTRSTLTNSTTLKLSCGGYELSPIVRYQVVSNPNFNVQQLEILNASSAVNDYSISSVNLSKSYARLGLYGYSAKNPSSIKNLRILNSSTIRLEAYAAAVYHATAYIIEDERSNVQSGYSGCNGSNNQSISNVDTSKSFVTHGSAQSKYAEVGSTSVDIGEYSVISNFTSSDTVVLKRGTSNSNWSTVSWSVVEYKDIKKLYPFIKYIGFKIGKSLGIN